MHMKNRREFLGWLGMAITTVFLPGGAIAHGWRRRRCRSVNQCAVSRACDCACPQAPYGDANGIFYYLCICCPDGGNINLPNSKQLTKFYTTCPSPLTIPCDASAQGCITP